MSGPAGVLIVSGGREIRSGSWGGQAHMAARIAAAGVPVSVIRDSAGFVAQRILATIVNVGCDIVQQRVCTPGDLDLAVTLGLSYPKGPLAFGDALGPANILTILRNIHQLTGDPRYRPSPWLTRRARLGVSLLTPDN
jgi:3-hydroxybutyryl-CoA dehydrogenase